MHSKDRAPGHKADLASLLLLGLVMAVSHDAISLELSVNTSQHGTLVQAVLLLLYPVAYAFVGVGAVMDHAWLRRRGGPGSPTPALRVAGLALLAFLLAALRVNGLSGTTGGLVASTILATLTLSAWFCLLGVGLSKLLSGVKRGGPRTLAQGWAVHLAGLLLGYGLNQTLVMNVGVNALLLCLGLALLILPRWALPALVLLLALAATFPLDAQVEQLRDVSQVKLARALGANKKADARLAGQPQPATSFDELELLHRRWSPYTLFMLVREPGADTSTADKAGIYNFKHQWDISPHKDDGSFGVLKRAAYTVIRPEHAVMIIGTGGGRGLASLPIAPHPGVVAVERDPAVVDLLTRQQPSWNDHLYNQLTVVAADGRHAVETWPGQLDVLVLESARYQPLLALCSASSPHSLYTRQALATYLEALSDDGLLMVNFNRTGPESRNNYLARHALRSLDELGATVEVLSMGVSSPAGEREDSSLVFLVASRNPQALAAAVGAMTAEADRLRAGRAGIPPLQRGWMPSLPARYAHMQDLVLDDDRPFLGWFYLQPKERRTLLGISALILLLCAGLAVLLRTRGRPSGAWDPVPYFVLIGIGHTGVQVASFYAWRSYFGDEITTMTRLLMAILAYGAIGSWLAGRLPGARLARRSQAALAITALGLHALGMVGIPFESSSTVLREAYAALALLPGGLLMGSFFPIGAARVHPALLGRALLADALGVLACYAMFFLVYLPLGSWAFLGMACAAYLGACAVAGAGSATQSPPPETP
jgi:spermidine synthase